MARPLFFSWLRPHLIVFMLLPGAGAAWAQAAPHGYDFLTVAVEYSYNADFARIYFLPAIQDQPEIPLEPGPSSTNVLDLMNTKNQVKYKAAVRRNMELTNKKLAEVTATGWELTQVWQLDRTITHYLFRRPRP